MVGNYLVESNVSLAFFEKFFSEMAVERGANKEIQYQSKSVAKIVLGHIKTNLPKTT